MNFKKRLDAYAEMLIKVGIRIKKDQPLVIRAPIEARDLAVLAAKHAYLNGASDVHILWSDDDLTLLRYTHAPEEVLNNVPEFQKEMYRYYLNKGAGFLSFTGSDPDLLKTIDNVVKVLKCMYYVTRLTGFRNGVCGCGREGKGKLETGAKEHHDSAYYEESGDVRHRCMRRGIDHCRHACRLRWIRHRGH